MSQRRFADASLDRLVSLTLQALAEPAVTPESSREVDSGKSGQEEDIQAPPSNQSTDSSADHIISSPDDELIHLRDSVTHALRGVRGLEPAKPSQGVPGPASSAIERNPMLQPPATPSVDIRR